MNRKQSLQHKAGVAARDDQKVRTTSEAIGVTVKVVIVKLTDGSKVYNVHVSDCSCEPLVLSAYDERSAENLADEIVATINLHSIDVARRA